MKRSHTRHMRCVANAIEQYVNQTCIYQVSLKVKPPVIDTRIVRLHHMLFKETFTHKQLHPRSSSSEHIIQLGI